MTIKQIALLLWKDRFFLLGVLVLFVGSAFAWNAFRAVSYETVLSLHIARSQAQAGKGVSEEYRYGDFYRLQADERFADTVVRWLLSPGIVSDVLRQAGIYRKDASVKSFSQFFSPKRLSSQFIEVRFFSPDNNDGSKIAGALRDVLNREAQNLNVGSDKNVDGWFVVLVDEPTTYLYDPGFSRILLFSSTLGIFSGLCAVFVRYAWKEEERKEK